MPHFPHTPEALLGRNDSKNAATTCKGITSTGRACRRTLASPKSSPTARRKSGALLVDGGDVQDADFFCWQHKDQAEQPIDATKKDSNRETKITRRSVQLSTLQERSSLDTLVQRLGIDSVPEERKRTSKRHSNNPKPPKRTETSDFAAQGISNASASHRKPKPKKSRFWASLCCMASSDDDYVEVVRHRKRVEPTRPPEMSAATPVESARPTAPRLERASRTATNQQRLQQTTSNEQTNNLLSLIPQNLPPQTTSALLAELIKPISPYDEDGYIYIFWLTLSSTAPPGESTAKFLLAPRGSRPRNGRRISDVMTEYSFNGDDSSRGTCSGAKNTVMLKIGRANNITRRMNEWQRQCGYALNVVRWYPYVPSSTGTPSPQQSPRHQKAQPLYPDLSKLSSSTATRSPGKKDGEAVHKCPHIQRVERLIHLELTSQQVKRRCEACGKEHREWFEVAATQEGVKAVDETVRRWIGWAERVAQDT